MTMQRAAASVMGQTPWSGDLAFSIECRTSPTANSGTRHTVVIHDDWSVTTPHDLEAERIAKAFGGYTSCVELAERTIPRLRESLTRVARRARPTLRQDKRRGWRVPTHEMVDCCRNHAYDSVRSVVEHLRSPTHLASEFGLPLWQVDTIVREVSERCRPELGSTSPNARYVRETEGLEYLWQAGIHPDYVPQLAAYASAVVEPLPTRYFEGIVYSGNRPEWINGVLEYRPDPDTAAWLAWQPPMDILSDAREWGLWLSFGVSRQDFAFATSRLVSAASVLAVVEATGWPKSTSARAVLRFAKADCRPTPEQIRLIATTGMEHSIPGKAAVDATVADVSRLGITVDRTELGVMFALVGNRPTVVAMVKGGAREAADVLGRQEWW